MWLQIKRAKLLIQKVSVQFMFIKNKFLRDNKFSNKLIHKKISKINTFIFKNRNKRQKHKRMIKNKANLK